MNNQDTETIKIMESEGWKWITTINKNDQNRRDKATASIAPWLTICETESDWDTKACLIWTRDDIPDGLQVNWK